MGSILYEIGSESIECPGLPVTPGLNHRGSGPVGGVVAAELPRAGDEVSFSFQTGARPKSNHFCASDSCAFSSKFVAFGITPL